MSAPQEKRQYPRAEIEWPATVRTEDGSIEGVTLNISPGGVFIRCRNPQRVKGVFDLVIDAPERRLSVKGEVAWLSYSAVEGQIPRGMGVRFVSISDEDRRFIAEAVLAHFESAREESEDLDGLHALLLDSVGIETD